MSVSPFLIAFAVAALVSYFVTPLVANAAVSNGWLDVPTEERRVHTRPIPRLGGIAVFASVVLGLLLILPGGWAGFQVSREQANFFAGLLLGGALLFGAGLVDDLRGLRPATKLAAQCAAALVVYAFGFRVQVLSLGLESDLTLGWLSLPLTVIWVVGVTNAFNLVDGLDGLATGIAMVALCTTLIAAAALGNMEVVLVCSVVVGALTGFLRYNFNPARIFLGDSGSLFVGFMLAVLSVHGSLKSATAALTVVPLFALALPILDTTLAIVRRWLRGLPLSSADRRHIHHQLLAIGLTHRHAVLVLYALASALAMLGLSLAFSPPAVVMRVALGGGAASLALLAYGMRRLDYHEFRAAGAVLASGPMRLRRIIQHKIHARDVSRVLGSSGSLVQVNAVLQDNATTFGFLRMEVRRESELGSVPFSRTPGAWRLDYPVMPADFSGKNPLVLTIWCGKGAGFHPSSAERAARILAPAIEEWLIATALLNDAPATEPAVQVLRAEMETEAGTLISELADNGRSLLAAESRKKQLI